MSNTYLTNNPLGSSSPKDLYDNASNIDDWANGPAPRYPDRFLQSRLSYAGMEAEFSVAQTDRTTIFLQAQSARAAAFEAAQTEREATFDTFLTSSGFQDMGVYAAGIELTSHNQYVTVAGIPYTLSGSVAVPYTTTGDWATDQANFVLRGDGVLRQDLANTGDPLKGSALVGRGVQVVPSLTALRGVSKLSPSKFVFVSSLGSTFKLDVSGVPGADNGGSIVDATDGGVWLLVQNGPVSVTQFGAVGDGVTDDTLAIKACIAAVLDIEFPDGKEFLFTDTLNFRSNQTVKGSPTAVLKYGASAPAANTAVLSMVNLNDAVVGGFTLKVDATTYPAARCLYQNASTDCVFENINLVGAGGNASYTEASTRCKILNCEADVYKNNGFYVNGGSFNVIDGCRAPDGSSGFMGAQLVTGFANVVRNCYFAKIPDNYFGIHSYACNFANIHGNVVENTRREALAVGGSCYGVRVHDNTLRWNTNLGVGDFGMSLAGDDTNNIVADFQVYGNTIIGSALDGIGVAGWTSRGLVHDNVIRDCAQMASSGHQSGIKLYGWITGAVVDHINVYNNIISKISGGGLLYGVTEVHGLGVASSNIIRDNQAIGLDASGFAIYSVEAGNSVVSLNHDDLLLKAHNAVPTAGSGTIASASGVLHFQVIGKMVHCTLFINIASNGSGAGTLLMTLPFTAVGGILVGAETAISGATCRAAVAPGGNGIVITKGDGSYPGGNGALITLSGMFRRA